MQCTKSLYLTPWLSYMLGCYIIFYKFYVATPLYRGLTSCQQRPSTLSNSNFTGAFKNKNQVASIHVEQNKIQIAYDSCSQILT
jgi:hypothetical protein